MSIDLAFDLARLTLQAHLMQSRSTALAKHTKLGIVDTSSMMGSKYRDSKRMREDWMMERN